MRRNIKALMCIAVLGFTTVTWAAFPLKVDIDVSAKRSSKQVGAGDEGEVKRETVNLRVRIRKRSGDIPEGKLHAELYVIGKQIQSGNYGIIDVQKGDFELLKENSYEAEYNSPTYTLGRTTGNVDVGGKYETYLVVVSGPDGEIIDWRSGRALRDEGVAFIRKLGPKTLFDKDGNVVGEVENPGEAVKAAAPAALAPRSRWD